MYGDNDTSEIENHITLDQTSIGQNAQKWGCLQVRVSMLYSCYVGQTACHLQTHLSEHRNRPGPVREHLRKCQTTLNEEDVQTE